MKQLTLLSKVRMAFIALISVAGIGTFSSFRDAQTPTYFRNPSTGGFEYLPGGEAGQGILWDCEAGSSICTYDENQAPIGNANRHFILIEGE